MESVTSKPVMNMKEHLTLVFEMAVCKLCSNKKGKFGIFLPIIGYFFFMYNGNAVIVFVMIMSRNDIEFDSSFTLMPHLKLWLERLKFYKKTKKVDIKICI